MADQAGDETGGDRWSILPFVLAALGLGAGIVVHAIVGDGYQPEIGAIRVAALSFVTVSAILFGFVAIQRDLPRSLAFAVGCGAVSALILYFNGATSGWGVTEGWRMFSIALAIGIAAPLFQAAREAGFRAIPYAVAHDHAWTNAVLWCLGWAFAGVVILLAWLLAALFNLIGIKFLGDWLQEGWCWRPLLGLAFGLGLALLREHDRIVRLLQNVAMLVLGVLAPVLALGLALFLIALPFTGLQPLWDATKATTPILLSCVIGGLLLVNAVVGNGGDANDSGQPRNPVLRWAALVLALTMLPLAGIAAVATGLRIGQYGFTPERLWALTFVILATMFAAAYLVSVVRGRRAWAEQVRPANLNLAIITCGVALLLATPLLSFNAISTRDQVARLESGWIAPDKFDWAALAFDFGEPGRAALQRLATSGNPTIRRIATDIAKKKTRWEIERGEPDPAPRLAALDRRLRILPATVTLPPALREALLGNEACGTTDRPCTLVYEDNATRALVFNDFCYRDLPEPVPQDKTLYAVAGRCTDPTHLILKDGRWQPFSPNDVLVLTPVQRRAIEAGYREGKIEVRSVQRRQVFVNGVPVGDPFE